MSKFKPVMHKSKGWGEDRTWYFHSFSTGLQPVCEATPVRLAFHGTLWTAEAVQIPYPVFPNREFDKPLDIRGREDIVFERFFSLISKDMEVLASENLGGRPGGLPRMSENAVSSLLQPRNVIIR